MLSLKTFLKDNNIVATSAPVKSGNLITMSAAWCETAGNSVYIIEGELQVRVQWGTLVISDQCSRKRTAVSPRHAAKYFRLFLSRKGGVTASPCILETTSPKVRFDHLTEEEAEAWLNPQLPDSRLQWSQTTERMDFLSVGERDAMGRLVVQSEVLAPASYEPPWTKVECRYAVLA